MYAYEKLYYFVITNPRKKESADICFVVTLAEVSLDGDLKILEIFHKSFLDIVSRPMLLTSNRWKCYRQSGT